MWSATYYTTIYWKMLKSKKSKWRKSCQHWHYYIIYDVMSLESPGKTWTEGIYHVYEGIYLHKRFYGHSVHGWKVWIVVRYIVNTSLLRQEKRHCSMWTLPMIDALWIMRKKLALKNEKGDFPVAYSNGQNLFVNATQFGKYLCSFILCKEIIVFPFIVIIELHHNI